MAEVTDSHQHAWEVRWPGPHARLAVNGREGVVNKSEREIDQDSGTWVHTKYRPVVRTYGMDHRPEMEITDLREALSWVEEELKRLGVLKRDVPVDARDVLSSDKLRLDVVKPFAETRALILESVLEICSSHKKDQNDNGRQQEYLIALQDIVRQTEWKSGEQLDVFKLDGKFEGFGGMFLRVYRLFDTTKWHFTLENTINVGASTLFTAPGVVTQGFSTREEAQEAALSVVHDLIRELSQKSTETAR